METVRLFVGFDQREAVAYHVFCQSVIDRASCPVSFIPIHSGLVSSFDGQRDGTNSFTVARYLIPYLCSFTGWALFADGDMICERDIADLWNIRNEHQFNKAVCVVRHDYKTKHPKKYIGSRLEARNIDYPRKNWSSVMLWNCGHYANRILTPEFVTEHAPQYLHRFEWLRDEQIGTLPPWWNHLVDENPPGPANLRHFTLGVPGFKHYADCHASWNWHGSLLRSLECAGEDAVEMVTRAKERIGAV